MSKKQPAAKIRHAFHIQEFTYPSNLLTLARLVLLIPTLIYLRRSNARWQAAGCISVAMLTDALDGFLARRRNEVSPLGEILDPIADKLVLDTTAITLSQTRGFPWWATGLLLLRDMGILLAAWLVYRRKAHITEAQTAGKATTVGLTAAILLYTLDGPRTGKPVLYITMLPFALSFWQYGRRFLQVMRKT